MFCDGGYVFTYRKTAVICEKNSKLVINNNLHLNFGADWNGVKGTLIRLKSNGTMLCSEKNIINYGADILVADNATLQINGIFINSDVRIRCFNKITIGQGTVISYNTTIMDSDAHQICRYDYEKTKPIYIGNHVWIGSGVTILKGVTINSGAVIAAGSVVTKDVPSNCLVAGCPAKVIKTDVEWSD